MTAANAHVILTQGTQQIAASAPAATAVAVGWITGALVLIAAGVVLQRLRRRRITHVVFGATPDELDVPEFMRTPTQPSPVVTHHDAMRQRWAGWEDDSVFYGDGVTEAIRKINEEGDRRA